MKKRISLFLMVVMLATMMSVFSVTSFAAEGDMQEFFVAGREPTTVQGQHITISSDKVDEDGWFGGSEHTLTVQAENGYIITDIEAEIGWYADSFESISPDHGTKREKDNVTNGSTVHFDDIDNQEFNILKRGYAIQFNKLTVYYQNSTANEMSVSSETFATGRVPTTKGQHITVSCDQIDKDGWYGGGDYTLTVQAEEGYIITDIEAKVKSYGHLFRHITSDHGTKREKGNVTNGSTVHFDNIDNREFNILQCSCNIQFNEMTVYYQKANDNSAVGSVLSESNMAIVVGIAAAIVVGLGGFVLIRKKKSTSANIVENDEE